MSINNCDSPGARLRHIRVDILRLTQDELAAKLEVTRSLIPMMEKGKQGVSRATAEKLYALWGINMTWLLTGDGEPYKENDKASPVESDVIKESGMSYGMSSEGAKLFTDPSFYRDSKGRGRFGYVTLSGTKLRIHAARDSAIAGSRLFQVVEDDKIWFVAGEPSGWEFEVLREYFDYGQDRGLPEWMECLRLIRWQRQLLIVSARGQEEGGEVKSA